MIIYAPFLILMAVLAVFAIFPWLIPVLLVGWLLFYFAGGILFWVCLAIVTFGIVLVIIEDTEIGQELARNLGKDNTPSTKDNTPSTYDDPVKDGWY